MDETKHTALTAMLESIAEQDGLIHTLDWRVIQAALRKAGDAIQSCESKLDALTAAAHETKRWNMHSAGPGELQVCFGEHERGTACRYVNYVEASRLEEALKRAEHYDLQSSAIMAVREACNAIMGGNCSFVDDDFARCLYTMKKERDDKHDALQVAFRDIESLREQRSSLESRLDEYQKELQEHCGCEFEGAKQSVECFVHHSQRMALQNKLNKVLDVARNAWGTSGEGRALEDIEKLCVGVVETGVSK